MQIRPAVLNIGGLERERVMRTTVLRLAGFEVVEAATADDALLVAAGTQPHVAVMDGTLPGSDCMTACESLRTIAPNLPIVVVLPATSGTAILPPQAAAVSHLPSPPTPEALLESINEALRGSQDGRSHSWVITDHSGGILEASAAGAALLNVSKLHLRQRSLVVFFDGDRPEWQRLLEKAARGEMVERSGWIRPRDRRRRPVHVALVEAQDYAAGPAVLWQFNPADRA